MAPPRSATAIAHSNIALVKYWGKQPRPGNFPAVPSLSLTLNGLFTETEVSFDDALGQDEFWLDDERVLGARLDRVTRLLDTVRNAASLVARARVASRNNFPTASGLASSASGFAALALAASSAADLRWSLQQVSALARASSASAARSLFGGWVALQTDANAATPILAPNAWDVALVVAVTDAGPKAIGSTDGMNHCSKTSSVYPTWLTQSPAIFSEARRALEQRDIEALGHAMEASTWLMHATMLAADPAVVYLSPKTLELIKLVRERRNERVPAYFTTDAGPHVKVLTLGGCAEEVGDWLRGVDGVLEVLVCRPGPDAHMKTKSEQVRVAP
jgi:diphosphomevalonate decarboxylase